MFVFGCGITTVKGQSCAPELIFDENGIGGVDEAGNFCVGFVNAEGKYFHALTSDEGEFRLTHNRTGHELSVKTDLSGRKYFLVTSLNQTSYVDDYNATQKCGYRCDLVLHSPGEVDVWLRGILPPNKNVKGHIQRLKKHRFGIYLRKRDFPVSVVMIPKRKLKKMDLDLRGYTELSAPSSGGFFFPNKDDRNYKKNYRETIKIVKTKKYDQTKRSPNPDGSVFYIFEVYASRDTPYSHNFYNIQVLTNYYAIDWIQVVFWVLISVIVMLTCTVVGIIGYRERARLLFTVGVRTTPHINGASKAEMKRSINKLQYSEWKSSKETNKSKDEDGNVSSSVRCVKGDKDDVELDCGSETSSCEEEDRCSVCLCEMEDTDQVGVIKCNHVFHLDCLSEWLRINKVCPLCLQDITVAVDQHGQSTVHPEQLSV